MSNENVKETDYGYFLHWANFDTYSAKIHVFSGQKAKTKLMFHKDTDKSFFINSGNFLLQIIDTASGELKSQNLQDGNTFTIPKLVPYQITCLKESGSIAEVSAGESEKDNFIITN